MKITGNNLLRSGYIITLFVFVMIIYSCTISKNINENDLTGQCAHCHGENLQGIYNVRAVCGECHDISKPLAPEKITGAERKSAVLSEPHVHKIKNVFAGSPSCFSCHRKGSF